MPRLGQHDREQAVGMVQAGMTHQEVLLSGLEFVMMVTLSSKLFKEH
jgi:hypothetical protein